ncbi:hypothetical protein BGZ98_003863 [Dissophora globulifera]|nr:hypothetical protein BGZ98_003863 [Dissophora globulifera]
MDNPPPAHNASCSNAIDIGMDISVAAVSNPFADKALQMFILLKDIIGYARHRAFITNCKQKLAFYVVPNAPLVHLMHAYIVSNGDIRIKALSEAGNQDYYSLLFWGSIRPSYDGVVTTTDILFQQLSNFPTEDSWLWCGTYLRSVLRDLEGWNREDDGVVDDDDYEDDDTPDPAMVFWRERREFLYQKGVLDDIFLPNLDWSEPALTENQDQDHDQDSLNLPVATLIPNGNAAPQEERSNDVVESYSYPINISDDLWAPIEFSSIPLEEPKRVSSKKRLRDEDTDDSDRVDFSRPLYCTQSVAMLVGISFMKLTISLHIFTKFPNSQESELTQKRSDELHVQKRRISKRRLAMSEVGGEFLWSGLDGGLAMVRLWFSSWKRIETWSRLNDKFRHTRAQALDAASSIVVQDFGAIQAVEQLLGYVFEDKRLLVESLTCRSAPPNYDRLEYLGDTVLELIAAAYWARRLPESQSSASSYLAAVSVCNVTLGVMCLHAGLYRHIQYSGKQSMTDTFDNARVNVLQAQKSPGPYWLQFKISKVLVDVMESVFGAVFLDSGCQYGPVCDLFMRLLEPKIRHLGQDVGGERSFKKSRGEFKAEVEALIEQQLK